MNLFASLRLLALAALCASPQLQAAPAATPADAAPVTVHTRPGAMVSRIAAAHRPAGATQDQTLLAILRANPGAFMGDNINLLMKGATLTIPPAAQVLATPADEARRLIQQQHADYARHGQALAHRAPAAGTVAAVVPAVPATTHASAAANHGANNSGAVAAGAVPSPNAPASDAAASAALGASAVAALQAGASATAVSAPASAMTAAPVASAAASATQAAGTASAVAAPALPASAAAPASSAAAASQADSTLASLREHGPLFGSIMVIVGLVGWGFMRSARKRREEEEQLAAAAAAEPAPRPAAEALARAMEDSVEVPPGDLEPATPEAAASTATTASAAEPDSGGAVSTPSVASAVAGAATATASIRNAPPAAQPDAAEPQPAADLSALSLDLNELHGTADSAPAHQPVPFDFSSISLELDEPAAGVPGEAALQTRLALAREFLAIDDLDGARVLAQEVARLGNAEQQAEAQAMLQRIDGSHSGSA